MVTTVTMVVVENVDVRLDSLWVKNVKTDKHSDHGPRHGMCIRHELITFEYFC